MFHIHIPSYSQSSILLYTFFPDFLLYYISIFVCRLRFFGGFATPTLPSSAAAADAAPAASL